MKKIFALVLAMMMLCSVSAFAEDGGIPFEVGNLQMTIPAGATNSTSVNGEQITGTIIDGTMIYIVSTSPFQSGTLENSLIYTTVENAMYQSLDPAYTLVDEQVVTIGGEEARLSMTNLTVSGRNVNSLFFAVMHEDVLYMAVVINAAGETTYEDLNTLLAMIDAPELFQNPVVLPEAK